MSQSGKALTTVLGVAVGAVVIVLLGLLCREFYVYVNATPIDAPAEDSVSKSVDRPKSAGGQNDRKQSDQMAATSRPLASTRPAGGVASREIRGIVKDEQGVGLAGATIVVQQFGEGRAKLAEIKTDNMGAFSVKDVPGRFCQVSASLAGLVSQTETRIVPGERYLVFRLETGGQVVGQVLADIDGNPIAGATVRGRAYMDRRRQWRAERITDSSGEFRFDAVPARTLTFEVDADGFQPRVVPSILMKRGLELVQEFRLKPGLVFVGLVVDGETSRGVEGARVRFGDRFLNERKLKTDARGEFLIKEVARGIQLFEIEAEGFGDLKKSVNIKSIKGDGQVRFELFPARSLNGRVEGPDEKPVADAEVFLGVDSPYIPQRAEPSCQTGRTGEFEIPNLTAGHDYFLLVRHPDFPDLSSRRIKVTDYVDEPIVIQFVAGATIVGRVENRAGEPVHDARIVVTDVIDPQEPDERIPTSPKRLERDRGRSDADGRFKIPNLTGGVKRLVVSASPEYLSRTVEVPEIVPGTESGEIVVILSSGETITGTVVGVDSEPVPGVRIQATSNDSANPSFGSATSNDEGVFRILQLSGASFKISARKQGYSVEILSDVAAGDDSVQIILKRNGTVSGTVRARSTGDPVPRFLIRMTRTNEAETPFSRSRQFTSDEGAFFFPDIMPGEYRLEATAKDFAPGVQSQVRVMAGEETRDVRVELPGGAVLTGTVVDTQGQPVNRATVFAKSVGAANGVATRTGRGSPQSKSTLVLEGGAYKIAGLGDGEYEVYASAPRYSIAETEVLLIIEGLEAQKNFVLSRGGGLKVHVLREGEPAPRVKVDVRDANGRSIFPSRIKRILERYPEGSDARKSFQQRLHRTDRLGRVSILNLPVGGFRIVATSDDGAEGSGSIQLTEGADVELTIEIE